MTRFGTPPQPINPTRYQAGWDAKMSGEWTGLFGYWTDSSWRAGWSDAKKELTAEEQAKDSK